MSEIQIGTITISCYGRKLTLVDQDNPSVEITLTAAEIPKLVDFLVSIDLDETERRTAFRLPVSHSMGLSTNVTFKGKNNSVTPINLSLTGIQVRFSEDDVPDISIGDSVTVSIQLKEKAVEMSGIVLRRIDNRYGILFPDSLQDEMLEPPNLLMVIFKTLETQWLRTREKRE